MRVIKFRAWDGSEMIFMDMKKDGIYPCGSHKSLMQYTGLKDKNGVEIYEGDIVRHDRVCCAPHDYHTGEPLYPEYEYIRIGKITIRPSQGVVISGTKEIIDYNEGVSEGKYKYSGNPGCYSYFSEVIGNIHENPELLK